MLFKHIITIAMKQAVDGKQASEYPGDTRIL